MPKLQSLFPTLIYSEKMKAPQARRLNAQLSREVKILSEVDRAGVTWSKKNYGAGYTSYSSITDLPFRSSNFRELKLWLDRQVARYARDLDLDLSQGSLEMTECWVNSMEKGCYHSFHLHPLSVISGTYYVDTPAGSGAFKIEDPRLPAFMGSAPRKASAREANTRFHRFHPTSGTVLLFESWLKHEVEAHRGTRPRISVSFNYGWIPRS